MSTPVKHFFTGNSRGPENPGTLRLPFFVENFTIHKSARQKPGAFAFTNRIIPSNILKQET